MLVTLGIVGKTNSGKSTLAKELLRLADTRGIVAEWFDADAETHRLYREDADTIAAIASAFPDTLKDGRIDTAVLAHHFTADDANRQTIEAIVYPALGQMLEARQLALRKTDKPALLLLDAPVLFKAGWQDACDALLYVTAPYDDRKARAMTRWMQQRGISQAEAEARFLHMDALQPDAEAVATLAGDLPLHRIENRKLPEAIASLPLLLDQLFPAQS